MTSGWMVWLALVATEPGVRPLGLDEAFALADAHPRLGAYAVGVEHRARWDREVSALTQNPTIGVFPGWRRHGDGGGFEGILTLSQSFFVGGPGRRGRDAAEARTRQAATRAELVAFQLRTETAVDWLELYAAQEKLRSLVEESRVADQLVETIARGVTAGRFLAVEQADAEIYRAEIDLLVRDADGERVDLAFRLARTLALDPEAALESSGPPPDVDLPAPLEAASWLARAEALPAARLAVVTSAARTAERALAVASASTNLQASLSLQREATGDVIGLLGLSATVPLFNRNERSRAESDYQEVVGQTDADLARVEAKRAIVVAFHEVEHTQEIADSVSGMLLPAAERYAALVERQLERARVQVVDVLRARRRVSEERRRQIDADHARRVARIRAALLVSAMTLEADRS